MEENQLKCRSAQGDPAACGQERDFSVQALPPEQVRALYRRRMTADFPPDELKPLSAIERALARGKYACYGAMDGEDTLAYAFFVKLGEQALFDYYAVARELRGQGIGSRFMQALIAGPLRDMDCVLLEVDDPDFAPDAAELDNRRRRLDFYLRNGLADTGLRARVWRVEYRILALPVGRLPSRRQAREIYTSLYRAIMPPEIYAAMVELPPT